MVQLTAWSVPSLLAVAISLVVWRQLRLNPNVCGLAAMRWLVIGVGLCSLGQMFGTLFTGLNAKVLAATLQYAGIVIAPAAWFAFSITYARGIRLISTRFLTVLLVIPVITIMLVVTNEFHELIWTSTKTVLHRDYIGLSTEHGFWFYISAIYSFGAVFAATVILAYTLSPSRSMRLPLVAVIAAPVIVLVFSISYLAPWNPVPWFDFTPLSFAIAAVMLDRGVLQYGMLDVIPVMRHRVFEKLDDAVVIVDRKSRIVDANPSAMRMLSLEITRSLSSPVNEVIHNSVLLALMEGRRSTAEITVKDRTYDVVTTVLDDSDSDSDIALVFRDITERREAESNLQHVRELAHTDYLTGLYNRRYFMERLAQESERVRRHGHSLSVLVYDLDHFKRVNDTHGHDTGDRVLQEVSRVVQNIKRSTDVSARLGGEEFALLLPETNQAGAMRLAQRLRANIELARVYGDQGNEITITASIGIATVTQVPGDPKSLLSTADAALYRAKNNGRNMVCTPDDEAISGPGD